MSTEAIIETERLILRRWHSGDLNELADIFGNKKVMHYFPKTSSRMETQAFMKKMNAQIDIRSYGYFAAELKENKVMIGFTGISYQDYEASFTPCVDIGWRLSPLYWGKGLATEAAKACLKYGFANASIDKIYSIAPEANKASIAVMKKLDMVFESKFDHPALIEYNHLNPCVVYSLDKVNFKY